jgi:hypothetical protein
MISLASSCSTCSYNRSRIHVLHRGRCCRRGEVSGVKWSGSTKPGPANADARLEKEGRDSHRAFTSKAVITTIFPRIYARMYYAHPRARVMSFTECADRIRIARRLWAKKSGTAGIRAKGNGSSGRASSHFLPTFY